MIVKIIEFWVKKKHFYTMLQQSSIFLLQKVLCYFDFNSQKKSWKDLFFITVFYCYFKFWQFLLMININTRACNIYRISFYAYLYCDCTKLKSRKEIWSVILFYNQFIYTKSHVSCVGQLSLLYNAQLILAQLTVCGDYYYYY